VSATGSVYCTIHNGGVDLTEQEETRGYLLSKLEDRARLTSLSDELEPVKELHDAISLTHMLIEKRYNIIQTEGDLLAACGPLNQLLQTMERLVNSTHRIETNLGELLARHAVITLAKEMVKIVIEEIEGVDDYEAIIDRITERLIETVGKANNIPQDNLALPPPERSQQND
jgi:hypothetical protein